MFKKRIIRAIRDVCDALEAEHHVCTIVCEDHNIRDAIYHMLSRKPANVYASNCGDGTITLMTIVPNHVLLRKITDWVGDTATVTMDATKITIVRRDAVK